MSKEELEKRALALFELWEDAYSAFTGAFDTPVARRAQNDVFSVDARERMKVINDLIFSISSDIKADKMASQVKAPPVKKYFKVVSSGWIPYSTIPPDPKHDDPC